MYTVTYRLYRTADDHIVPDGHHDARWLYATPHQRVPARRGGEVTASPKSKPSSPTNPQMQPQKWRHHPQRRTQQPLLPLPRYQTPGVPRRGQKPLQRSPATVTGHPDSESPEPDGEPDGADTGGE